MAENFAAPEAAMAESVKSALHAIPTAKILLLHTSLNLNELSCVVQNNAQCVPSATVDFSNPVLHNN